MLAPDVDYETRRELAERYKGAFRELNHDPADSEGLFAGAKATIAQLAARDDIVLGIATGKSRRGVDRLIDSEGWHDVFSTIQTADDHPSKPDPSMIYRAMLETGASPGVTVMIGDTSYDIAMARSAGVGALGVTWGYHHRDELNEAGAHFIIDTYAAMPDVLDEMFQRLSLVS